ncbi:hypothetical protein ACPA9J_04030 [Pseudomonas aeruginosa]
MSDRHQGRTATRPKDLRRRQGCDPPRGIAGRLPKPSRRDLCGSSTSAPWPGHMSPLAGRSRPPRGSSAGRQRNPCSTAPSASPKPGRPRRHHPGALAGTAR